MDTKKVMKVGAAQHHDNKKGMTLRDDGIYSSVEKIFLYYGRNKIDGVQFLYCTEEGKIKLSDIHGAAENYDSFVAIDLDRGLEWITSVKGYRDVINFNRGYAASVTSITFETNKATYGPFGQDRGSNLFSYSFGQSFTLVGFNGRLIYGRLDSIGVHIRPKMLPKATADDASDDLNFEDYQKI